tara:strand:- start:520 stop:1782 length:1263 start_codon:yes stop_codon:yes gene_type:complete
MSARSDRWKAACNATAFVNHVSMPSRNSALAASGVGTPPTAVRRAAARDGSGELLERVVKLQQENRVLVARAETAEAAVLDLSREKEGLLGAVREADTQTQTLVEAAEVDARARSTMQDELEALGQRSERLSQELLLLQSQLRRVEEDAATRARMLEAAEVERTAATRRSGHLEEELAEAQRALLAHQEAHSEERRRLQASLEEEKHRHACTAESLAASRGAAELVARMEQSMHDAAVRAARDEQTPVLRALASSEAARRELEGARESAQRQHDEQIAALRARALGAEGRADELGAQLEAAADEVARLRDHLALQAIDAFGVEEAARRMEAELKGRGLLAASQSVLDATAPSCYLMTPRTWGAHHEAHAQPSTVGVTATAAAVGTPLQLYRYSCLQRPQHVPLPASPPRLGLADTSEPRS